MAKTEVSDIVDRRNESRRYMQSNYWEEWEDAFRAIKCRTKPIMTKDRAGNDSEDTTRTNVCMPEISLLRRRKVARLTANPPQINYTTPSGDNDPVSTKLTALAFQQFDRSGEALEHRRVVDSGITFGVGYSKVFWDTIEIMRRRRKAISSFQTMQEYQDFTGTNKEQDAEYSTQLDEDLIKQLMQEAGGDSVQGMEATKKYEGPCVKNIFVGDLFIEPGARILNESGWVVESYWETDIWLQKMLRKRYQDPDSGELKPLFDLKACEELFDMPAPNIANTSQQPFDLRTRLRTASMNQTIPQHPSRLVPGKRFDILESHQRDEYGQMWITWVGNEKVLLGKMPYPWDLYGKYVYTEFVPMPDILNAVGDSTPRLMRWLHMLHNVTVGSRKDLVNAILRPLMGSAINSDIPDEAIERKLFKVLRLKSPSDLWPINEPASVGQALASANEEEAQIMRMIALFDPNLSNVETGTETNPQAGKTATTAVLAAKSADALTQFELDGLNLYLKELGEKKLWMNQQAMQEPTPIDPSFAGKVQGLSQRYNKSSGITLDPMEIQEDIQVEPSAGSMLAVDDDIRRNAAMQFYTFAVQDPVNLNVNYAAEFLASTIRGIDPTKAVNPPAPPTPPPPKMSVAVAIKYPELPLEAQMQLLQGMGAQRTPELEQEMAADHALMDVGKVSAASDAAANITAPPEIPENSIPGRQLASQEADKQREHDSQIAKTKDKTKDTPMTKGVND